MRMRGRKRIEPNTLHALGLIQALALILVTSAALPGRANAIIDMKNSNYSESWVDIQDPSSSSFTVQRYYNSRTDFNGLFGYGWCSDFETTATVTPEGAIDLVSCGAGQSILYVPSDYQSRRDHTIEKIVAVARGEVPEEKLPLLGTQLRDNASLRVRWAQYVGLATPPATEESLFGNMPGIVARRHGDRVELLRDGKRSQSFDAAGRLVEDTLAEGKVRRILRDDDGHLQAIWSEDGQVFRILLTADKKKIASISTPFGPPARYAYDGEYLVSATDMWRNTRTFEYNEDHRITRITFPDGTFKALTYNTARNWVLSFAERAVNGISCREDYQYDMDPIHPTEHFWSTVVKVCGHTEMSRAKFEFWYSKKPNGDMHLSRIRIENTADTTDLRYDVNGQVETKKQNTAFLRRFYTASGLLRAWYVEPTDGTAPTQASVQDQDPCGMPALIKINRPGRSWMVHYTYDQTCRLQRATGSNGVSLTMAANGEAVFTHEPAGGENAIAFLPDLIPNEIADRMSFSDRLCDDWKKYKASGGADPGWRHCGGPN